MSRAVSSRAVESDAGESIGNPPAGYLRQSTLPLPSLVLLLPLVILYEVGTRYFTTAALHGKEQQIIAFTLMQQFFGLFGANARHLPALAVVGVLLAWHIARNDKWNVEPATLIGMLAESILLSMPLFGMGYALAHYFPLAAVDNHAGDMIIMSLGAGVYEELVFRLILFTLLSIVLRDLLDVKAGPAYLLVVILSGVLFSLYHYWSPGEQWVLRVFAFRTLAGMYFGVVFMLRGFGITAVSHAAYDIILSVF